MSEADRNEDFFINDESLLSALKLRNVCVFGLAHVQPVSLEIKLKELLVWNHSRIESLEPLRPLSHTLSLTLTLSLSLSHTPAIGTFVLLTRP